jgi:hypothetical protein
MSKNDKNGPISGRLANTLYTLGLLSVDEGQFLRLLTSREMEEFEALMKENYPHQDLDLAD